MNKRLKFYIFILFLLIITIPSKALAEEVTCSKVNDAYNSYKQSKQEFDSLNCYNLTSEEIAGKCNKASYNMGYDLQLLFEYSNTKEECVTPEIEDVINENSDKCTNAFDTDIKEISSNLMKIFYIIAPFLLIIFGSVDFFKIVTNASPETIKKSRNQFAIRVISFVLLFVTPAFVKLVLSFLSNEYKTEGVIYTCETNIYSFQKRYTANYIESGKSASSTLRGQFNGQYTIRDSSPTVADAAFYEEADKYGNVGQCVWYARSRAKEISEEMEERGIITESDLNTIKNKFNSATGNGGMWLSVGNAVGFATSTDINEVSAPALISWTKKDGYGHVAVIEYVDDSTVIMSEGYATNGVSCPETWSCVNTVLRTYSKTDFLNGVGTYFGVPGYNFSGYIYFTEY